MAALLAFGSMVVALLASQGLIPAWQSISEFTLRRQYWEANLPSWQAFDLANHHLNTEHDKILLIGETRAVWLQIPFIAPAAFNGPQLPELFSENVPPGTWTARLHALGITHLLITSVEWQRLADSRGYFRLTDDHLKVFYGWLRALPVVFDDHHGNVLVTVP